MIERPDADALMAGPLGAWLSEQNAGRSAAKAKAGRIQFIAICAACGIAVIVILFGGAITTALQAGGFVGVIGFGFGELTKRPMLNRLKGGINGAIAKALGLEYSVDCEPGKTFERAKQFEMVPGYDDSAFQDLWWGVVSGRPFTLHEAKLTEQQGSGKSRRTVTVFEGTILAIGFNRRFSSTTLIEADGERRKFLFGSEKDRVTIGGIDLQRVDMVNPEFEKRFTVWSTDQTEARYLVHPAYVERMLAVESAFSGENIRALFAEGELLIALETGDLFESGSLDAGDDRALLEKSITQFGSLAQLAEQLNERERMTMSDIAPT
jgi:Protein of unknown function (DUF3137)